ncbi:hypothetical protein LTR53_019949, partial [Teratosphaeriaceae sp. CCFEE 6253]
MSNPSIPSVISEASSVDIADGLAVGDADEKRDLSSDDTLNPDPQLQDRLQDALMDAGYTPDQEGAHPLATDADPDATDDDDLYDSSSDSDGGLVMTRRKSKTAVPASSAELLAAALERPVAAKERRGTGLS